MLREVTLGQYYPVDSVIHRLDPRVKLLGTVLFLISLFIVKSWIMYGVAALALAGCVAKADVAASDALTVTSSDGACDVSAATAKSGTLAFDVTNSSQQITEFYLLASDGLRIVGEVENIAPGSSRTLTVVAQPGDYFTLCKPGMIGEGVGRAAFTVTGDAVAIDGPDAEQKQQAVNLYAAFVKDQVGQLLPAVQFLLHVVVVTVHRQLLQLELWQAVA